MPNPHDVSPDAALQIAMELLKDTPDTSYRFVDKRFKALAENYIAQALGGKPLRVIEAMEYQDAVSP